MPSTLSWLPWALASAVFAALTAIFGKVGVALIALGALLVAIKS